MLVLVSRAAAKTALAPVAGVSAPPLVPATKAVPNSAIAAVLRAAAALAASRLPRAVNSFLAIGAISLVRSSRRVAALVRSLAASAASYVAIAFHAVTAASFAISAVFIAVLVATTASAAPMVLVDQLAESEPALFASTPTAVN